MKYLDAHAPLPPPQPPSDAASAAADSASAAGSSTASSALLLTESAQPTSIAREIRLAGAVGDLVRTGGDGHSTDPMAAVVEEATKQNREEVEG
jgi:hypothetical protein